MNELDACWYRSVISHSTATSAPRSASLGNTSGHLKSFQTKNLKTQPWQLVSGPHRSENASFSETFFAEPQNSFIHLIISDKVHLTEELNELMMPCLMFNTVLITMLQE